MGKYFHRFQIIKTKLRGFLFVFFFKENGVIWNSRFWESLQDIDMQYDSTIPSS